MTIPEMKNLLRKMIRVRSKRFPEDGEWVMMPVEIEGDTVWSRVEAQYLIEDLELIKVE